MKALIEIKVPDCPNFLLTKEEGITIPIHKLNDKELKSIGKQWTINLLAKAKKNRATQG